MSAIKLVAEKQKQFAIDAVKNTEVGKNYEVVIRKCKRSNPQNSTFHLWCTQIAVASDCYTMEQVKKLMKQQYGVWEVVEVYGKKQVEAKSTAKYSTGEMAELMKGVQSFADDYGIEITNPEMQSNGIN